MNIFRTRQLYGWLLACFLLALPLAAGAITHEFDFGLPLFGSSEIRFETTKRPDHNFRLFEKYINENPGIFNQLHAANRWMNLIRFSDSRKSPVLTEKILQHFEKKSFEDRSKRDNITYLFLRGLILSQDKEADPENKKDYEYEDLLLQYEKSLTDMAEYWLVKGFILHQLRNRPNRFFAGMRPMEDLKRAAGMAPKKDPLFYYVLAQAFRYLGSDEASLFLAVASYEKSSSLAPENSRLNNSLLGIYMGLYESYQAQSRRQPFWLAESVYKRLLIVSPRNPYAMNNLGYLYAEYGINSQRAVELCQRAVDSVPCNAKFRNSLGWAHFRNGDNEKAVVELKKSTELDPAAYDSHYHLATVYYMLKRYEEAIPVFERALEIRPNSAGTLNNYAYMLAELNRDIPKAYNMSRKSVQLEPENPFYLDTLGWIYYRRNEFEKAMEYLKKADSIAPDVGEIMFHIGEVYMATGNFEAGVDYLKRAWKADPTLDGLDDSLFLGIALKGNYQSIIDYHRTMGEKAIPARLKTLLLSLAKTYQDNGRFSRAIELIKLCDELQAGRIDLSKPLFDFYILSDEPEDTSLPKVLEAPEEVVVSEGGDFEEPPKVTPAVSPVSYSKEFLPLALHFGPAFFRSLSGHLQPFERFSDLSLTVGLSSFGFPTRKMIMKVELPGMSELRPLKVLEFYLTMLGCKVEVSESLLWEMPGLQTNIGGMPFRAVHFQDALIMGGWTAIDEIDPEILLRVFPNEADAFMGMVINWPACYAGFPWVLRGFLKNPISPFSLIHSTYYRVNDSMREVSLMIPEVEVDREFMDTFASVLLEYEKFFGRFGCELEVTARAGDTGIELAIIYHDVFQILRAMRKRYGFFLGFFNSRLNSLLCVARRKLFSGNLEKLDALCPSKGSIFLNPGTGAILCSEHRNTFVLPLIADSVSRCGYSLYRLKFMMKKFLMKLPDEKNFQQLLNSIILEYNISPCPSGGRYIVDEDGVPDCTIHGPATEAGEKEK